MSVSRDIDRWGTLPRIDEVAPVGRLPLTGDPGKDLELRRYEVARLYLVGMGKRTIAKRLGIPATTAQSDIAAIQKGWQATFEEDSKTIRAQLDHKFSRDELEIRGHMENAAGDWTPAMVQAREMRGQDVRKPHMATWTKLNAQILKLYDLRMRLHQLNAPDVPLISGDKAYALLELERLHPPDKGKPVSPVPEQPPPIDVNAEVTDVSTRDQPDQIDSATAHQDSATD